jgi:hypothetical protein
MRSLCDLPTLKDLSLKLGILRELQSFKAGIFKEFGGGSECRNPCCELNKYDIVSPHFHIDFN